MKKSCLILSFFLPALFAQNRLALRLDTPAGMEILQSGESSVRLSGALAAGRVARLEWRNTRGTAGTLDPSPHWTTPGIHLFPGKNHIVITAIDDAGYSEQTSLLIHRTTGDPLADSCIEIEVASEAPGGKNPNRLALVTPAPAQRWTNATIPYLLDPALPAGIRGAFLAGVQHWQDKTPIRLIPRSTEANYVHVIRTDNVINTAGGVGMIGGEQIMRLVDNVDVTTAIHEIGHSVGFAHEQSRTDRDRFIQMQFDNIRKEQFAQVDYVPSFLAFGVYDIQSIMQYFVTEISRTGDRIFRTVPDGLYTTNFAGLSPEDVDTVERMYNRPSGRTIVSSNPPGLQVIVDGQAMTAPAPFTWAAGSTHTIEAPALEGSGAVRNQFARWSNDGARLQTVTASTTETVFSAHYLQQCRMTLAAVDDPATGSYTVSPYSPDDYYPCDAEITLTATPAPGYTFLDWNTVGLGSRSPIVFRLATARDSVKANFTNGQTVTFVTNPPQQNLIVNGSGIITPRTLAARPGAIFNVSAIDRVIGTARYRFASWSQGGAATQQIVAGSSSATYTATFNTDYFVSNAVVPSADTGTITQTPASADSFYPSGSTVTFRATPAAGRDFRGWSGDLQGSSLTGTVQVTEQRYVAGNFRVLQAPTITGLTPARATAGVEPITVFVDGAGFVEAVTQMTVNGKAHPTSVQGFNSLYFQLTADDLKSAGALQVRADNPGVTGVAAGAQTFTVAAPPANCAYVPAADHQDAGASGGTFVVALSTGAGCPWYPTSDSAWIEARAGSGSIQIWVKPNPSSQPRAGTVTAAGKPIAITQAGTACNYLLSAVADFPAGGGDATAYLSVPVSDCAWSLAADADWLEFPNGLAGTANAAVALHAGPNSGAARQTTVSVGAAKVLVVQAGSVSGPSAAVVLNEASWAPDGLAPAGRFVLAGSGLSAAAARASGTWPETLGGTSVLFADMKARLLSVSPTRIVGQVPSGIAPGSVNVTVMNGDAAGDPIATTVQSAAPGIYSNVTDAVPPGGVVALTLTGAGLTNPAVNDGEASPADTLAVPMATVSATIGSVDAPVVAAEMLPGEVGILRVRITVPAVVAGDQPAVVSIGGVASNAVRIRVAPSL